MKILVTGGAGFIGSAVCRHLIDNSDHHVVNVDKLTYAANLASLAQVENSDRYTFVQADICEQDRLFNLMNEEQVDAIMHLAAESHVDRSIDGPADFLQTNIVGTYHLLEAARRYWETRPATKKENFRFHHISTDEVFGDLPLDGGLFTEETSYNPSSPYSATKAGSDHLVRAWHRTFGLPVVLSNCSNNYGPYQFPEKLVPLMILNALEGKSLPVYGDGSNVRDWLYVDDHARALTLILTKGKVGQSYNVGGGSEQTNLQVVETICKLMDDMSPMKDGREHKALINFVTDRPGHDLRYAIDASKIEREFGWTPQESFESGLEKTVRWYLERKDWWQPVRDGHYSGERLGQAV